MKIEIGKHYLIRQRWQYGEQKTDDIMVLKCIRAAEKNEIELYRGTNGFIGADVRDVEDNRPILKYFEDDEVISSIRID